MVASSRGNAVEGDRPRLRVAIFGESYLPYLSGVTISTEALASGLVAAGHEVILAVPAPAGGPGGPSARLLEARPGSVPAPGRAAQPRMAWLPSYQPPSPAPPGYRMPMPLPSAALRAVRATSPDIVHAQSPFVSGVMARATARAVGAPLVFTHHTRFGDYAHYLGPAAGPAARLVTAYLARFWRGCAAVIAPSGDLADEISRRLAAHPGDRGDESVPRVRAIPTGVDVAAVAALAPVDVRPTAGWDPDATVVVSVGRLAREKNVSLLLEAFAAARQAEPRLRLLLVGDGPARAEVQERAGAADLADAVHLAGARPHGEALALAGGADLFAFASQTETQGLVLAEALAAGLPVVALAGPGVADSVRDGIDGRVVPEAPGASQAQRLGAAIAALAADAALRRRMGIEARDGAKRFDAVRRIGEVVDLYRGLLGAGGQRG
jgi:1,2-diacylglycerol 3-alpha-glucosyltransferase